MKLNRPIYFMNTHYYRHIVHYSSVCLQWFIIFHHKKMTCSASKSTFFADINNNYYLEAGVCTFRIKSGGVPGLTVGLRTPSWWEWIKVSSRSRTKIFLFTESKAKQKWHLGLSHNILYFSLVRKHKLVKLNKKKLI